MKIIVKDVETPEVGPRDILLRPAYVGICGSEVQMYRLGYHAAATGLPPSDPRRSWRPIGHEASGTIAETGSKVKGWRTGDRYWSHDIENSFADYVAIAEDRARGLLHHLPDELSSEQGALLEPLNVAMILLSKTNVDEGKSIAILGGGSIGLLTLQAAKVCGASSVYVSEVNPLRIERARELGADEVMNPKEDDVVERVRQLTKGVGVDVVIETAGLKQTFDQMVNMLRYGGRGVILSWWEKMIEVDLNPIVYSCLEIVGSKGPSTPFQREWLRVHHPVRLMSEGKINVDRIITSKVPLEQIDEAFQSVLQGRELKVLVHP